jgi:hypothetical protein
MKRFSEYDIRQIFLLRKLLEIYISYKTDNKKIYLCKLIKDVEALLQLISNLEQNWFDDMASMWFDLEIVYAISASENREFTKNETQEIEDTVIKMKEMVDILISENNLHLEDEI